MLLQVGFYLLNRLFIHCAQLHSWFSWNKMLIGSFGQRLVGRALIRDSTGFVLLNRFLRKESEVVRFLRT